MPCAAAYNHAVTVSLNATDAGSGVAQIHYTTDGSTPTASSGNLYLTPFTLAVSSTVRYRAFDNAGNAEPVNSKTIRIDTTPPVLTVPSSPTVATTSSAGATVKYTVTATDPDDAVSTINCAPSSGSQFPVGDTTVRCTAADTVGNVATATFVIHVRQPLIGAQTLDPAVDYIPAGLAEAFQLKAGKSGTLTGLSLYIDASSNASRLVLGVYADTGGHPGNLLAQSTLAGTPLNAAWNTITLTSIALTSGKPYWVAVLEFGGQQSGTGTTAAAAREPRRRRRASRQHSRRFRLAGQGAKDTEWTVHCRCGVISRDLPREPRDSGRTKQDLEDGGMAWVHGSARGHRR